VDGVEIETVFGEHCCIFYHTMSILTTSSVNFIPMAMITIRKVAIRNISNLLIMIVVYFRVGNEKREPEDSPSEIKMVIRRHPVPLVIRRLVLRLAPEFVPMLL
jgi:hypothetical protein